MTITYALIQVQYISLQVFITIFTHNFMHAYMTRRFPDSLPTITIKVIENQSQVIEPLQKIHNITMVRKNTQYAYDARTH